MRRYVPLLIAGAALIAAACRDAIAPSRASSEARSLVALTQGPHVTSARADHAAESKGTSFTFTIDPEGGWTRVGNFRLVYPSHAVCDPDRSEYGPDAWDEPCPTLKRPIRIRARVWVQDGTSYADFRPNIRFDPEKEVKLFTVIPALRDQVLTDDLRSLYSIGYTLSNGSTRYFIDEGADDSDLATHFYTRDGKATGLVSRRIQHFSGYYVRAGYYCEYGSTDPNCTGTPLQ